ncbi:MAG: LCP family protein [Candidatus Moranbacteria bacterium]|nr:LCP family protein [Candidatus Moranbacteria bacterium]
MHRKRIATRIFLWFALLLLLLALGYVSFFFYKLNYFGNKVNPSSKQPETIFDTLKSVTSNDASGLKGAETGRINILLLGTAGKGKPGQNLTDTIMILSVNLKTNQVALLSLPRDLYARVPGTYYQSKINSVYQAALNRSGNNPDEAANSIKETVKDITSLDMNYYVVLDFDGFKQVVDAVGGINITSERDIYDATYPGPNYSYETFELKKGFHQLDGATALKYARERHDDPEGDFGRAKRQQQIMQATKNKIFSAGTFFNIVAINNLINALGDNIRTDISPNEAASFFELSKKLDTANINNVVVDAWNSDSLLKVSHVMVGNVRAFVLIPRISNYSEIHDLAQNVFDLNKIKRRKEEISDENATVAIINKSGDASLLGKIEKLLNERFGYKSVITINDPMKFDEETSTAYDPTNGSKPFTLDEIATKLPAKVSYDLPEGYGKVIEKSKKANPDITVILGKDLSEKYRMEEDSIDDLKNAEDDQNYMDLSDNTNSNK